MIQIQRYALINIILMVLQMSMSFTIFNYFFLHSRQYGLQFIILIYQTQVKFYANLIFFLSSFIGIHTILSLELGGHFFLLVFYFLSFFWGWVVWVCFVFKKGVLGELSLYLFYLQDSVSVSRAPLNVFEFFFVLLFFIISNFSFQKSSYIPVFMNFS